MTPLGYIESYESFKREINQRLETERAIGFLLDCPRRKLLERSGLINSARSVEGLDRLMSDRMSIYYLSPLQLIRQKRAGEDLRSRSSTTNASENLKVTRIIHERFNELILSGLQIPHRIDVPCLLLFRPRGNDLAERKYYALGEDSCFYYEDLYQAILSYCHPDKNSAQSRSGFLGSIRETYKSIREDLPKTVIAKTLESSLLVLEAYLMNR